MWGKWSEKNGQQQGLCVTRIGCRSGSAVIKEFREYKKEISVSEMSVTDAEKRRDGFLLKRIWARGKPQN